MKYPKNKPIRLKGKKLTDLKHKVYERDNYRCQVCGVGSGLEIHHIKFLGQGGSDIEENMITLCRRCHGQKHGVKYCIQELPF